MDDMVIVRGVNVYPAAVEEILRRLGDVAEYRVHVGKVAALAELRVEVGPTDCCPNVPGLKTRVQQALETAFDLRFPVETVAPGSWPRFEMKAGRCMRS